MELRIVEFRGDESRWEDFGRGADLNVLIVRKKSGWQNFFRPP